MKNRKRVFTLLAVILVIAIGTIAAFRFLISPNDQCTPRDREQNNCVPAGRCTPPGDPRESAIDCEIKSYDHRFSLDPSMD